MNITSLSYALSFAFLPPHYSHSSSLTHFASPPLSDTLALLPSPLLSPSLPSSFSPSHSSSLPSPPCLFSFPYQRPHSPSPVQSHSPTPPLLLLSSFHGYQNNYFPQANVFLKTFSQILAPMSLIPGIDQNSHTVLATIKTSLMWYIWFQNVGMTNLKVGAQDSEKNNEISGFLLCKIPRNYIFSPCSLFYQDDLWHDLWKNI